ncbi:D-methionine transport system substrate-binding protein [Ruminococcaceae bacterium KH2T8]|nr:D-methionine transport system substrate-binding protein [Ruminococcaceae bacterium KH2T8]
MKTITLKKIAATALSFAVLSSFAGCSATEETSAAAGTTAGSSTEDTTAAEEQTAESVTITVGASITPHTEILEIAKPILAEQGITLEIVSLEDYITPNTGVIEGSLDANYCEHQPYLDQFNAENGSDLVSIGAIHYEPFGIYAGRVDSLADLPDGATIAVPNDVTNEARALLLLEQEGFITLSEDAGINATVADITDNPHDIQLVELAPEQLVATLPDVDFAVINGNYAIEGGLHVSQALAVEANDGLAAQTYGNIIVTTPDHANDPALIALVEVLQSPEISEYITATYDGAVVPLY